jgi:lysophospholipase L1-like esterase
MILLLMVAQFDSPTVSGFTNALRIIIVASASWAMKEECDFRRMPELDTHKFEKVFVIGDALSAGIGYKHEKTWAEIASRRSGLSFIQLSAGGATVDSSLESAELVNGNDVLVILEIGGNDILRKTDLRDFRRDLNTLFRIINSVPGRTVLMFEMPTPPLHKGYNMIQREAAAKYHANVVPSWFFAKLLTDPKMTVDGLHLSFEGQEKVAALTLSILERKKIPREKPEGNCGSGPEKQPATGGAPPAGPVP